jgi:hypothetical protein
LTLDEARAMLVGLRGRIDEIIATRADLAELRADLAAAGSSPLGAYADTKGMEALLFANLESLGVEGVEVKGFAPLLLDFIGERDGRPVLWCWLEGEDDIGWYHRLDTGFAGRRPV